MAQLMQAFDARNVDPTQGVGGLPIGRHPVQIVKSEVKPTKDGSSGYVQFDLSVLDGPNKGAVGAYRLNLYHDNPQTVEIAHRQLSALCHVTGVYQVQDTQQLHNVPFVVEVGLQKEPNPNKYTEVKRVFDINGNEPGQQGQNNGGNAGGWNNGNGQQQQNNQQQGNGNNAAWGGQNQVANNVPMPNDNGNQNQNQNQNGNGNGNGGWNNQQGQGQGQGQQGNGNGGWNNQQGNGQQQGNGNGQGQGSGNWAQNNNGQGGGNPAWGQPR